MGVINLLCVRGWKGGGICLRVCVNASPLFTPYLLPCASCDNFICYLLSHVDFLLCTVFFSMCITFWIFLAVISLHYIRFFCEWDTLFYTIFLAWFVICCSNVRTLLYVQNLNCSSGTFLAHLCVHKVLTNDVKSPF